MRAKIAFWRPWVFMAANLTPRDRLGAFEYYWDAKESLERHEQRLADLAMPSARALRRMTAYARVRAAWHHWRLKLLDWRYRRRRRSMGLRPDAPLPRTLSKEQAHQAERLERINDER